MTVPHCHTRTREVPEQKEGSGQRGPSPSHCLEEEADSGQSCRLERGTSKASVQGHWAAQLAQGQSALFSRTAGCVLFVVTLGMVAQACRLRTREAEAGVPP